MKLALIFLMLSALVVISSQQFQQSPALSRVLWWLPQHIQHNNYQPSSYQHDDDFQNAIPLFRQFYPIKLGTYSQQNGGHYPLVEAIEGTGENPNVINSEDDDFTEGRNRGFGYYQPTYLPPPVYPRFFFNNNNNLNGAGNGFNNPLLRTATFTFTSTLTLTSVQSCIPAAQFAAAPPPACRRRRDIDSLEMVENVQFPIIPSETEHVLPTDLPTPVGRILRQLPSNEPTTHEILSSKDEESTATGDSLHDTITLPEKLSRERRFFFINRFGATTTVTSYSLISTTITQKVTLGADKALLCVPAGYLVC